MRLARAKEKVASKMRDKVLRELHGRLWHTTHPVRFQSILNHGAILPEPNIPDCDRWHTSQYIELYPYVRILGGVSLFDFDQFDPKSYGEKYPMSSWYEFVPYRKGWGCSVWIEIDRQRVAEHFISGLSLRKRRESEKAYRHPFMPVIEATHLGPVERTAFKRVFLCRAGNGEIEEVPLPVG